MQAKGLNLCTRIKPEKGGFKSFGSKPLFD
jgi:hypothetical protein